VWPTTHVIEHYSLLGWSMLTAGSVAKDARGAPALDAACCDRDCTFYHVTKHYITQLQLF